jgi:hypothetical protein
MMKLNLPWELGPLERSSAPAMFAWWRRPSANTRGSAPPPAGMRRSSLSGCRRWKWDGATGERMQLPAGAALPGDGLYIVLDGTVGSAGRSAPAGRAWATGLLTASQRRSARCKTAACLLSLRNFDVCRPPPGGQVVWQVGGGVLITLITEE